MAAIRPTGRRRCSRAALATAAALVAALGPVTARAIPAEATPSRTVDRALPAQGPAAADDPALRRALDAVIAYSPPETCLAVAVDGVSVYGHDDDQPLVPASVEKLFTAHVAFDVLGSDTRFETQVVATATPADGVVQGDLTLVGGGDPMLVTDAYREVRRIGPDRPSTRFDDLADQLVAAGVRRVSGRVVGDEARYDQVRTGPTWPERYTTSQQQAGPLSALEVDDGYALVGPPIGVEGPVGRERAVDPAANAARLLTERLVIRGVQVDGAAFPGAGRAPASAVRLAGVTSAPLGEIVDHLLRASDNQAAELLTKEIGRVTGGGGSTEAGAAAIDRRLGELGVARAGADAIDGSGLDPANRATCASIVSVLEASGGPTGPLAPGLPVAGRSGTLADRFRGTPAEGRLRAKTGSLNSVTSLAGFVDLPEGGTATFAYVANGRPVDADVLRAQDLLASVLGGYLPPCPAPGADGLVAPLAPYAAQVGTLAMFPLQSVLLPGAVLPLHVFEDRYRALVDRCLALQEDFGVALIARGSEVGGHDVRTDVGTRARILEAQQADDGRWAVLAVGVERIRIDRWLPDDPYPLADVAAWPDPPAASGLDDAFDASTVRLRRVLGMRTELGEPGPPATTDLAHDLTVDDPSLLSHRLVGLSPVGDLDRQRLLAAPDIGDRLLRLDALLDEEEEVCRARLAGG